MIGYLSLLVAVVGAFIYALSDKPKPQKIGTIMLMDGLLAFLIVNGQRIIDIAGK